MRKLKNPGEIVVHVKIENIDEFFERGQFIARRLDKGEKLSTQRIISFEDPENLAQFLIQGK